jgi:hypothetical protein
MSEKEGAIPVDQFEFKEENDSEKAASSNEQAAIVYDEVETKRILRKVDLRLLPCLTLLYLLSFLDRGNSKSYCSNYHRRYLN